MISIDSIRLCALCESCTSVSSKDAIAFKWWSSWSCVAAMPDDNFDPDSPLLGSTERIVQLVRIYLYFTLFLLRIPRQLTRFSAERTRCSCTDPDQLRHAPHRIPRGGVLRKWSIRGPGGQGLHFQSLSRGISSPHR